MPKRPINYVNVRLGPPVTVSVVRFSPEQGTKTKIYTPTETAFTRLIETIKDMMVKQLAQTWPNTYGYGTTVDPVYHNLKNVKTGEGDG